MAAAGGLAGWLFGRRTYEDLLSYWGGHVSLRLTDSVATATGVLIATYEPTRD
jgi:hypothetical protein